MTLRRFLLVMIATTTTCWIAFGMVVFRIDPTTGGPFGLGLFLISLFFALWGTFALAGFGLRYVALRNTPGFRHVGVSLRQALWFAILVCLTLLLISQQLLLWWMSLLLVLGFVLLEGFFLARSLEARYYQQQATRRRSRRQ